MSTENRAGRQGRRWRPTKEFLTSDPRSAEIRDVCVGIVRRLDALLHNPEVADSKDRQLQLYSELEMSGGRLLELGIRPGMHVGSPLGAFQSSPVTTMEYVAGQLIKQTGVNVVSESAAMPIIQEMSEAKSGPAHLISDKNITPRLKDFIVMRSVVNVGYSFLDAEPEDIPEDR